MAITTTERQVGLAPILSLAEQNRLTKFGTSTPQVLEYQPGGTWSKQKKKDLLVFDVNLYKPGSYRAIYEDAKGLVREKISGEKKKNGQYYFDEITRVVMQLTPPEHYYVQAQDPYRNRLVMACPEHVDEGKDVLETISDWRGGVDRAAMKEVKDQFFNSPVGTKLFWFSGRAEKWEDEQVRKYNGEYGYLYSGTVVEEEGIRKLVVHDFKTDLSRKAYDLFIQGSATSLHYTERGYGMGEFDSPLYQKMTTVGKIDGEEAARWTDVNIWRALAKAKGTVEGNEKIFNLSVEQIIKFQDPEFNKKVEQGAATEVATWISDQIDRGISSDRIQAQVRHMFISATQSQLEKLSFRNYDFYRDGQTDLIGGRRANRDLGYTGSVGNFCGDWDGGLKLFKNGSSAASGEKADKKCKDCGFRDPTPDGCGYCDPCGKKRG